MNERLKPVGQSLGLVGSGCLLALGGCAGFVFIVDISTVLGIIGALAFLVGVGMFFTGVLKALFGRRSTEK